MARFPQYPRSLSRPAIACVAALVAALLYAPGAAAAPAAAAARAGGLHLASAAEQPRVQGTSVRTSKPWAPARRATAARDSSTTDCIGVRIGPGSSPTGGYLPLSSLAHFAALTMTDDDNAALTVPSFTYNGRSYTDLQVDSNGYLQVGTDSAVTPHNQDLPDPAAPNDVLAPFWTDLNPGTAGQMGFATVTDGTDEWILVAWEGIPEFSTPAHLHTFEVWIGVNTDAHPGQDISYAYGDNTGSGDGGLLTVGAEDAAGVSGAMTYLNGLGTLPTDGTQLVVTSSLFPSFTAVPTSGPAPLHVDFDASASFGDGSIVTYFWDFGDGVSFAAGPTLGHDYGPVVTFATLTVTDSGGNQCQATQLISVNGGFSVDDVTVNESAGTATFLVAHAGAAASVDVAAIPGTASTPADFVATATTMTFPGGTVAEPYVVTIKQDTIDEPNETFTVRLSNPVNATLGDATAVGTIVDDDPQPRLSVNDVNVVEGDSGTKNLVFKVKLTRPSAKTIKVSVHTADGSARAPGDYQSRNQVLTFTPGQTVISVPVAVVGDRVREPNETFFLLLNNPVNAPISDPTGVGGIINND